MQGAWHSATRNCCNNPARIPPAHNYHLIAAAADRGVKGPAYNTNAQTLGNALHVWHTLRLLLLLLLHPLLSSNAGEGLHAAARRRCGTMPRQQLAPQPAPLLPLDPTNQICQLLLLPPCLGAGMLAATGSADMSLRTADPSQQQQFPTHHRLLLLTVVLLLICCCALLHFLTLTFSRFFKASICARKIKP